MKYSPSTGDKLVDVILLGLIFIGVLLCILIACGIAVPVTVVFTISVLFVALGIGMAISLLG